MRIEFFFFLLFYLLLIDRERESHQKRCGKEGRKAKERNSTGSLRAGPCLLPVYYNEYM